MVAIGIGGQTASEGDTSSPAEIDQSAEAHVLLHYNPTGVALLFSIGALKLLLKQKLQLEQKHTGAILANKHILPL